MLPRDLRASDFERYPAGAKEIALRHIALLRRLPPFFAPMILREVIAYDWKFPAETNDLHRQLDFLKALAPKELHMTVAGFAALEVTPELQHMDWVNQPSLFAEQATAHLWATHQIEAFRGAAVGFVSAVNAAVPETPAGLRRVGIVVIGQGVPASASPLFRKLRPHGTYYSKVQGLGGFRTILASVRKRATENPLPYGHWYIDGGHTLPNTCAALTELSYESIRPFRAALQERMQKAWDSGIGSEALRTLLAQLQPDQFGMHGDPVFDRFQLSLLTEASGTQVYSTTFAQWAAREVFRRAQPVTLLLRFAPRQKERAMNELLAEGRQAPPLDPESSLRDADMGAYYTWLNQQRLTGNQDSAFLVWFEDHQEAIVIAPGVTRGTVSHDAINTESLLAHIGL